MICSISQYVRVLRDRSPLSQARYISSRRSMLIYNDIIDESHFKHISLMSKRIVISYDDSNTYVAMEIPDSFNCMVCRVNITIDNVIYTPRIKTVYKAGWSSLIRFMTEWNKWNAIDTVRLTI